jgi:hypothetical protein
MILDGSLDRSLVWSAPNALPAMITTITDPHTIIIFLIMVISFHFGL